MARTERDSSETKDAADGILGGSGRRWRILSHDAVQPVPEDLKALSREAGAATRRFPEASWTEGVHGLEEVAERGKSHPGELGDLVQPTERAAHAADAIKRTRATILRLEAQLTYHRGVLAIEENAANVLIDEYEEEATKRIERGRIPADAYDNLRKYVSARGESISKGIAQSKALQKAARDPSDGGGSPDAPKG